MNVITVAKGLLVKGTSTVIRKKRIILTITSLVGLGASIYTSIKASEEVKEILNDTKERRHSEDKKVRRDANIETIKRAIPAVAPAVMATGLTAGSIIGEQMAGTAEINTAMNMANMFGQQLCQNELALKKSEGDNETEANIPVDEDGNIIKNAEEHFIPLVGLKVWTNQDKIDKLNVLIENSCLKWDVMYLSEILEHLGVSTFEIPKYAEEILCYSRKKKTPIPHVRRRLPTQIHDGKLMYELDIECKWYKDDNTEK